RIRIGAPRAPRQVHAALILVALHELLRGVRRPVDERAESAALDHPVLLHLLVERDVRAACGGIGVHAKQSARGLVPLRRDDQPALPRLRESLAMRRDVERRRRRREKGRAVVPADESRPSAPHLELLTEPLRIRNLDRLFLRYRVTGAQRAGDAEVAQLAARALTQ